MEQVGDKQKQLESCRDLVQLIIDNEASDQQVTDFKKHYEECIFCKNEYSFQAMLHEALVDRLSPVQVPEGLADAIRAQLGK